jgi:hypothetical protein
MYTFLCMFPFMFMSFGKIVDFLMPIDRYYTGLHEHVEKVIVIDSVPERLAMAQMHAFADHIINFTDCKDVVHALREWIPDGPDVVIDTTGFRYAKSLKHKIETKVYLGSMHWWSALRQVNNSSRDVHIYIGLIIILKEFIDSEKIRCGFDSW